MYIYIYIYVYICMGLKSLAILFFCLHRNLQVFGNPLGCVLVPDSVTSFDTYTQWNGYDETARCGDNCTELTVYVPSDGVCVQCPDGLRALGVGALACSVLLSERCFLRPPAFVYFCVRMCVSVYLDASVYLHTCICVSVCM